MDPEKPVEPAPVASPIIPKAIGLQQEVVTGVQVAHDAQLIRDRVVNSLVEDLISQRVDLLIAALAKRKAAAKALDKIGPDQCAYDDTGTLVSEQFSQPRVQEKQKATKALAAIDKAIDAAVNNASYDGLKKIVE